MRSSVLLLVLASHLALADSANTTSASFVNAAVPDSGVVCVYPISGQYGLLNRLLYYALIVFSFLGQRQVWLVTGALAYILTYSSTSAVHSLILTTTSTQGVADLDILGAWMIVSVGSLAVLPIFALSSTIRESKFSSVFGLWGTFMAIGGICSIVSISRSYSVEPECRSNGTGTLLTSPSELQEYSFECAYSCFDTSQAMRSPSELLAVPYGFLYDSYRPLLAALILTGVFGIYFGIFGFAFSKDRKRTESELRRAIQRNRPKQNDMARTMRRKEAAIQKAKLELATGEYPQLGRSTFVFSGLGCLAMLAVIILNEVYVLKYLGDSVVNELPYAVGQWAPWVGTILALMAAAQVKLLEPRWEKRQEILSKEKEARQMFLPKHNQTNPVVQYQP